MEVNTLILLGDDIFPGNLRKSSSCLDQEDNPGLSYNSHDEVTQRINASCGNRAYHSPLNHRRPVHQHLYQNSKRKR